MNESCSNCMYEDEKICFVNKDPVPILDRGACNWHRPKYERYNNEYQYKLGLDALNRLRSTANVTDAVLKWMKEDPRMNEIYCKVSTELANDQCHSLSSHIIASIEYLLDRLDD